MTKLFIIAGELSGDLHGQNLIRALRRRSPDAQIHTVGGEHMEAEHPSSHIALSHLGATGFTQVIRNLPAYLHIFHEIANRVQKIRPDAVIFIDNPGFNLRLAKRLQSLGIPMIYYICPQIWAWAEQRIHLMKRLFKMALVVFDFERDIYLKHAMPVEWVGHPLKDIVAGNSPDSLRRANGRAPGPWRIALMPGSRRNEVERLLPTLMDSVEILKHRMPDSEFYLIRAQTLPREIFQKHLSRFPGSIRLIEENKQEILARSDLGFICSGTATLECAMAGLPMIIVYRTSALTAFVFRRLIKTPFLGIPNLLAGQEVVPELLQEKATPARIAAEALNILENPSRADRMRAQLMQSGARLGDGHASERAADQILKLIQ